MWGRLRPSLRSQTRERSQSVFRVVQNLASAISLSKMSDSKAPFTLRVRKLRTNPLLRRRQMQLEILHLGRANVPKSEIQSRIITMFKVKDPRCVFVSGLKTFFGGGRSQGCVCVYDDFSSAQKFERKYRLVRMGVAEAQKKVGRRAVKELKNRKKKVSLSLGLLCNLPLPPFVAVLDKWGPFLSLDFLSRSLLFLAGCVSLCVSVLVGWACVALTARRCEACGASAFAGSRKGEGEGASREEVKRLALLRERCGASGKGL